MSTVKHDIPLKGRLVANPEAGSGEKGPVSRFRFVEEDYARDADGNLLRDGDGYPEVQNSVFHDAVVWYPNLGERVNATFTKGDAFLAIADLRFSSYEDKEGKTRDTHEFVIKQIGADISSGRVSISKAPKAQAEQTTTVQTEPVASPTK